VTRRSDAVMLTGFALSNAQFVEIGRQVYHVAGICLPPGKEGLVRSRLSHRLRALGLAGFDEYLAYLERDTSGAELVQMVDAICTNKTSFFRENAHFELLQRTILPRLAARDGAIRIWSAGCSSGQEPYTIAIVVREVLDDQHLVRARILATDLSTKILRRAREAVYPHDELRDVPPVLTPRHFVIADAGTRTFRVSDATRSLVKIARLNLMGEWPMRGPFDVVFCRNVMIYFDRATQERLVRRFAALLAPGGWLLVGHSESLTALQHGLRYVQPAVYQKAE